MKNFGWILIFLGIGGVILGTIMYYGYGTHKEIVKCYDDNHNEIIGVNCYQDYPNIPLALPIYLISGIIFIMGFIRSFYELVREK